MHLVGRIRILCHDARKREYQVLSRVLFETYQYHGKYLLHFSTYCGF